MAQSNLKIVDKVPNYFSDPNFGKNPQNRSIEELLNLGVINLDKPANPTSHEVTAWVKQIVGIEKAGHGGTLDPAVTGCLPIALGRATRALQVLLLAGKEYICVMKVHEHVSRKKLLSVLENFKGKIYQTPPLRSNIKRRLRVRKIYSLELLEHDDSQFSLLRISCEAGTYIRKLCLHPNTQILTIDGSKSISDFYNNHSDIYSFDNGIFDEATPSMVQKIRSPSNLIRITMSSGINLTVTEDHELLCSINSGYKMTEAKKLQIGNYLVRCFEFPNVIRKLHIADLLDDGFLIPQKELKQKCKEAFITRYGSIRAMNRELQLDRKVFLEKSNYSISINHLKLAGIYNDVKKDIYCFKTKKGKMVKLKRLTEDLAYLLGLIASDGNNTREKNTIRYTRIKFHNKERSLIDKFLNIYQRIFPDFNISEKEIEKDFWQLDTSNSFLATLAASLGIKSPKKDSDISPILDLEKKLLKSFLRGYFDGDGGVSFTKAENQYKTQISLFTVSKKEAIVLHKILLKIGIANKIFRRHRILNNQNVDYFIVCIENIASEKFFISEVGTNHPKKAKMMEKIQKIPSKLEINDHYYIGLHYKEEIRKVSSKLKEMGGNLSRVLKNSSPLTRYFYKRASSITDLPPLDDCVIEKIKKIENVPGSKYVYDMTVPLTHNFLIESGFISSNCFDIGLLLGSGAHMQELRRIRTGPFSDKTSVTLQDLRDAWHYYETEGNEKFLREIILPIETICDGIPKLYIRDSAVDAICHGAALTLPGVLRVTEGIEKNSLIAIFTMKEELVAFARSSLSSKEILSLKNGICAHPSTVFMEKKLYPSVWKSSNPQK